MRSMQSGVSTSCCCDRVLERPHLYLDDCSWHVLVSFNKAQLDIRPPTLYVLHLSSSSSLTPMEDPSLK